MANERMTVDALLLSRPMGDFRRQLRQLRGSPRWVTITPWTPKGGCLCQLAMVIPRSALESVTPTGEVHVCCGKRSEAVELHFKDGQAMPLEKVFGQMHALANKPDGLVEEGVDEGF